MGGGRGRVRPDDDDEVDEVDGADGFHTFERVRTLKLLLPGPQQKHEITTISMKTVSEPTMTPPITESDTPPLVFVVPTGTVAILLLSADVGGPWLSSVAVYVPVGWSMTSV